MAQVAERRARRKAAAKNAKPAKKRSPPAPDPFKVEAAILAQQTLRPAPAPAPDGHEGPIGPLAELRVLMTPACHLKWKVHCVTISSSIHAELQKELAAAFLRRGLGELVIIKASKSGKGNRSSR